MKNSIKTGLAIIASGFLGGLASNAGAWLWHNVLSDKAYALLHNTKKGSEENRIGFV